MIAYFRSHLQSLLSIGVRGASVVAGFVVAYYIGHNFGPLANGQYALVAQTAIFLSIVAVGGMDLSVVRHFSAAVAFKIPLGRKSLLRALGYSLGAGAAIIVILVATQSLVITKLFRGQPPLHAVWMLAAILLVRTTTRLTASVLRSQGQHLIAQCVDVLFIPTIVVVLLALRLLHGLQEVLYATVGAGLAVAALGLWWSLRYTKSQGEVLDVPLRPMLRTSFPLWLTTIAMNIADWYCLATAAAALGVYEAGLFRVAFQIGTALSFSATGLYNVFTAQISAAVAVDDYPKVARLARSATRLAIVLLLPVVAILLVTGGMLLGLIGPEFKASADILRVFLVGQLLYVSTGPAGLVLAMSGHERLNLAISSSVTAGLLIIAPIAAHFYGLYGLAAASASIPVIGNLASVFFVHRNTGINVLTGHWSGLRVQAGDAAQSAAAE